LIKSPGSSLPEKDIAEFARLSANILQPHHRKAAETLAMNIASLIRVAPDLSHVGMLTLTTEDNCSDFREFSKRWRSFRTNYLSSSKDFSHWVSVYERQARGAWHLHLVIIVDGDIRTGCDFEAFEKRKYRTAPAYLRGLWADLREACPRYGFGRHELMPVKSCSEAISKYVGKYVSKHIGQRKEEDKGKHQIQCSTGWPKNTVKWAWYTPGSCEWRRKTAKFARINGCSDFSDIRQLFGPRWAYHFAPMIYLVDDYHELVGTLLGRLRERPVWASRSALRREARKQFDEEVMRRNQRYLLASTPVNDDWNGQF